MRKLLLSIITILLFSFQSSVFANIYMGTDARVPPTYATSQNARGDCFGDACQYSNKLGGKLGRGMSEPSSTLRKSGPTMVVTMYPGSLKANIDRIVARDNQWGPVVWNLPYDYNWVGTSTIRASNLQGIMGQILKRYPIQAVFYTGNRVIAMVPRDLR